jgi:PTH1 family peptidyl-tRNA hydrolase
LAEASETGRSGAGEGQSPFLIVGLGNPGLEYVWTPHNAGFMAIDRIAQQEGVVVQNRRCRATTATCRIAGRQVVLAKPETFMNLSGAAVAALVEEFEADPAQDLLVIYDELDLVLGTFKIRERGSPAGHNGARSVTGALGTQEWLRLRIGVGPDLPPEAIVAGRKAAGQGLSAFAHAQGGSDGAGRGAGPGGNGHAAHSRTGTSSRDERVQPERQGRGRRRSRELQRTGTMD